MIKSMTGYGRAQGQDGIHRMAVELRSVNHRYCDLSLRLPKHLQFMEPTLKKELQRRFSRGHIELWVQSEGNGKKLQLILDRGLAKQYHRILYELRKELGLQEPIGLSHFVHYRDMIRVDEKNGFLERQARLVNRLVSRAMGQLEGSRRLEGKAIDRDFRSRLRAIAKAVERIEARAPQVVEAYRKRLAAKVRDFAGGVGLDQGRLAQEVALYAERSDISEEITRMKSHLDRYRDLLKKEGAVGRLLDFLIQEMVREVNTMGSKGNDTLISHEVVFIKAELEKLREQVQNVE